MQKYNNLYLCFEIWFTTSKWKWRKLDFFKINLEYFWHYLLTVFKPICRSYFILLWLVDSLLYANLIFPCHLNKFTGQLNTFNSSALPPIRLYNLRCLDHALYLNKSKMLAFYLQIMLNAEFDVFLWYDLCIYKFFKFIFMTYIRV